MKKLLRAIVLFALASILIAACGGGPSGGNYTVHMTDVNFAQSSITIPKGSTISLVSDSGATHILANGSWVNGSPQPMQESGAPAVNNVQVTSNGSQTIGPFNTSGTYHFYCTIHPGMSLTVIVQ